MTKWLLVLLPFLLVQTSRGATAEATRDTKQKAIKALPALAGRRHHQRHHGAYTPDQHD